MLVVVGSMAVKPGMREEVLEVSTRMAVASRAEAGCISYRFFSSLEEPDTIFAFEEWESEEALAFHFQTDHMKEFRSRLPGFMATKIIEVKRYDIQAVAPLRF